MNKIRVGDLIYRIYPSGKKILGIAATTSGWKMGQFPYRWDNNRSKWTSFVSLEQYDKEGGVNFLDGYGKSGEKFKYEKLGIEYMNNILHPLSFALNKQL